MKKIVFVLILFVYPIIGFSQSGLKIGLTGSYLMSRASLVDTISNQFTLRNFNGGNFGANLSYGLTDRVGLTLRTLGTMKGYRIVDFSGANAVFLTKREFHLEVPLHFYFKQKLNAGTIVRENIGIAYSGLLGKKAELISSKNDQFHVKQTYSLANYAMFSIGVEAGNVNKAGNMFLFGVFYRHSVMNANSLSIFRNKTDVDPLFNLNFRGGYISVGVSYLFNIDLKKKDEFFY